MTEPHLVASCILSPCESHDIVHSKHGDQPATVTEISEVIIGAATVAMGSSAWMWGNISPLPLLLYVRYSGCHRKFYLWRRSLLATTVRAQTRPELCIQPCCPSPTFLRILIPLVRSHARSLFRCSHTTLACDKLSNGMECGKRQSSGRNHH